METETLDFSVRVAASEDDLRTACAIRAAAYGHHDPQLGPRFGATEALDRGEGVAVLLCQDKRQGNCVGTMRVQLNTFGPLVLEQSIVLPEWLSSRPRAQISRLAVLPGADALVKLCLMKSSYHYCLATRARWMVIGARNAALIRNYRSLGFKDVFGPGEWRPLASGGGLPHQILALDVTGAKSAWQASGNRLYGFMEETYHADLQTLSANDSAMQPLEVANA